MFIHENVHRASAKSAGTTEVDQRVVALSKVIAAHDKYTRATAESDTLVSDLLATSRLQSIADALTKSPDLKHHFDRVLTAFSDIVDINSIIAGDFTELSSEQAIASLTTAAESIDAKLLVERLKEIDPAFEFLDTAVVAAYIGMYLLIIIISICALLTDNVERTLLPLREELAHVLDLIANKAVSLEGDNRQYIYVSMVPKAKIDAVFKGIIDTGDELSKLSGVAPTELDFRAVYSAMAKWGCVVNPNTGNVDNIRGWSYVYGNLEDLGYTTNDAVKYAKQALVVVDHAISTLDKLKRFLENAKKTIKDAKSDGSTREERNELKAEMKQKAIIYRNLYQFYFYCAEYLGHQWFLSIHYLTS